MAKTSALPPSTHHSVAVHFLGLLTGYLTNRGVSAQRFLEQANFDMGHLNDPNDRIPYEDFARLCELARDTLNEPCFGLKLGQSVRPTHLGSWGFALMSCSNGQQMIEQTARYSSLAIDAAHTVFERKDDEFVRYRRSNLPGGEPLGRLQDELSQAILVTLSRWLLNQEDAKPNWVSFQHPRPDDTAEYDALFRCPVYFDAPDTAIALSAAGTDKPLPTANPQLFTMMEDVCARLLEELGDSLEPAWLSMARAAVLASFKLGMPDLARIASTADMTEDELKKRLNRRGLSFRSFVDDLRHGLAMGYVRDPTLSLVDIAFLLGFSEQSAFQRAFKRWTGKTPGDYRKAL